MTEAASDSAETIIVFGQDDTSKPHASVFDGAEYDRVRDAARLMGMRCYRPESEHVEAATVIARQLPAGRLFDSGKAFVPFVRRTVYDQIAALAGPDMGTERVEGVPEHPDEAQSAPAASPEAAIDPQNGSGYDDPGDGGAKPDPWAALDVGSLVLAQDADLEGYFVAKIIKKKAKGIFTLRFRDYVDEPTVDRSADQLGLLHPRQASR